MVEKKPTRSSVSSEMARELQRKFSTSKIAPYAVWFFIVAFVILTVVSIILGW